MFSGGHYVDASSVDTLKMYFTSVYIDVGMVFQNKAEVSHTAGIKISSLVFIVVYSCYPYR